MDIVSFFMKMAILKKKEISHEQRTEGLILTYYENGNLESEETFKNGVLQGLCKYFDENGTLTSEGAFLENERNGLWKFYCPKTSKLSSQITIVKYDKGQALSTKVSTY